MLRQWYKTLSTNYQNFYNNYNLWEIFRVNNYKFPIIDKNDKLTAKID